LSEPPIENTDDTTSEANLFSFILRVWMEESASEERQAIWRGHVTPIPAGERYYFTDLNEIPALIAMNLKMQR
jgi:hypothetical protein